MDRDLLYRFFEGKTSVEEERVIRKWMAESKENEKSFLNERINFDALLFTTDRLNKSVAKKSSITPWMFSTAVAVALLLIVSGIYLIIMLNSTQEYNTILVPPGQRTQIVLADHSTVWLNANTTFRYPTQFSRRNRTVYLDGEAYLEVSKNEKKPFVVKTAKADIQVTGTSFNVNAYTQFDSFQTSLFEGGVDLFLSGVKLISLNPNEKATLHGDQLLVSQITDSDEYLWRHGLIAFNNVELPEILHTLEKYFDVVIKVNRENLPKHTYTGKFRQADGVDYALKVLQKSVHFDYQRDEVTGIIYLNQ